MLRAERLHQLQIYVIQETNQTLTVSCRLANGSILRPYFSSLFSPIIKLLHYSARQELAACVGPLSKAHGAAYIDRVVSSPAQNDFKARY